MKNQTTKHKIIFSSIFLICFVFLAFFVFNPAPALAINTAGGGSTAGGASAPAAGDSGDSGYDYVGDSGFGYNDKGAGVQTIKVSDEGVQKNTQKLLPPIKETKKTTLKDLWKRTMEKIKDWFREDWWIKLKNASAIAYKAALKNFLNNLAYDTATYLATGDKGQSPMFQTQGWGGYLQNAADNAAGTFIETLGKSGATKFNLCSPNFNVLVKINLGLRQSYKPSKPACTFSTMIKNWDTALQSKKFLSDFQDMFNPWSNDMGIALTLQTGMTKTINEQIDMSTKDRDENQGFKSVTDFISGSIKTPGALVRNAAEDAYGKSSESALAYTGTALADSIDIFVNTLVGKLLDKWLKQGLVSKMPSLTNKFDSLTSLTDSTAQNQTGGIAEAENRMISLVEPSFKVRADYDILAELVSCSDPNKAGPTDCVIDEKFRQAIEKKLTVRQALDQGYLNGNGIFGFTADGLEPKFNEGYPYRSMIILRKYRIIPVGWEVAAQKIKDQQDIVAGTKNLKDLVDCFSGGGWCQGLVDPDWVLKAPQNFCKREGVGPQILSKQVAGSGAESYLSVLRDDTYCADEQSCIKEKADGSCQLYGYCTEERRKWDFNAESCEPRNNTCQTFGSPSGQNISYLENTLDFGNCNAGNAGCLDYCRDFSWAQSKFTCATSTGNKINLNKQAEECDSESEGCHQFIRLNPGGGANLLINSGFEKALSVGGWDGTLLAPAFGATSSEAYQGNISLQKTGPTSLTVHTIEIASSTYRIAGESYTLSFYARDCSNGDSFSITGAVPQTLNPGADWVGYNLTYTYPVDYNKNQIFFQILSSTCLIDNIKLEPGAQATAYSDYAASSIYEKIMPSYLDLVCKSNNPPAECNNFARTCSEDEIGCELYTSVISGAKIPAKVSAQDYCPAECVGYDTFIQSETFYDSLRPAYFIPKTAKACSAEVNGCDQFTNLDEVARGGEGTEYYSYLRQCVKPAAAACSEFYSWEGSDESGYQLKVEILEAAGAEPFLTTPPYDCVAIYDLPPSDPSYNADCRQYYNRAGAIFYRLYSSTISCTDDCHPYKRTAVNTDESINSQATCGTGVLCSAAAAEGDERCWDDASEQCVSCKNGGAWSVSNQACIYNTIKSESTVCAAAQNGCREYTGNTGNNVRNIFTDDFFSGTIGSWLGVGNSTVDPSNESLTLGPDNKGHSILVSKNIDPTAVAQRPVGETVSQGSSYVLNFVAKASAPGSFPLTIQLSNGLATSDFAATTLTGNWQIFETNLTSLGHQVNANEVLLLKASNDFYINNITLTEIVDRYYLIKDSWKTPESCDQDLDHNPYPFYMLGCAQYQDRDSKVHNLRQFSKLCSESAAGCELMIDTHNSNDPSASYYKDGQSVNFCVINPALPDCVKVPADSFIYAVYDREKLCGATEKGCEFLGKPYTYEGAVVHSGTYKDGQRLENNPDQYNQILCGANAVGCEAYAYSDGEKYFKDPGDQVCQWRTPSGQGTVYNWYKKKVKRCDSIGNICLADNDCLPNEKCQLEVGRCNGTGASCLNDAGCGKCQASFCDETSASCASDSDCALIKCLDSTCPTNTSKTFGYGGAGNSVPQPAQDNNENYWAGICQDEASGCTEYIDPVSKFNPNIIFNGDFQRLASSTTDGWRDNILLGGYDQDVILNANTVYRLARKRSDTGLAGELSITCLYANLYEINSDNSIFSLNSPNITVTVPELSEPNSRIFYYISENPGSCHISVSNSNGAVELKQTAVDYQLRSNLDRQSCNGKVDFGQGCVLFNERKQSGSGLVKLNWDADTTVDGQSPAASSTNASENDTNIIIKVMPDRVCGQWLACKSYIKDGQGNNICFDIGSCDAVDANGNCQNFLVENQINQTFSYPLNAAQISNLSGYNKVGIYGGGSLNGEYYPFSRMEQKGEKAGLVNGDFEFYGVNGYPMGWKMQDQNNKDLAWADYKMKIISNPIMAQAEEVNEVPSGSSFLKIGSSFKAVSEKFEVLLGTEYILTGQINTKKLSSGEARISVSGIASPIITLAKGQDWTFRLNKFTAPSSMISLILWADAGSASTTGNFYFDDIKIIPALNSKSDWYTPQACRLYPSSDSLACDYFEDSGKHMKGWPGYCLEYDRRPGDPNTCLLWYPIDKVKGDGIEEGAGYNGRAPLYYCQSALANRPVEKRKMVNKGKNIVWGQCEGGCLDYIAPCPPGYQSVSVLLSYGDCPDDGCGFLQFVSFGLLGGGHAGRDSQCKLYCNANGTLYKTDPDNQDYGWYDYLNGIMPETIVDRQDPLDDTKGAYVTIPEESGIRFYNAYNNDINDYLGECFQVVQTVSPIGQNKYYSARVYENSDYKVDPLGYIYTTYKQPFGAALPPAPTSNPYEWSGESGQPLYVLTDDGIASAGSPYSFNTNVWPNSYIGLCERSKRVCLASTATTTAIETTYSCKSNEGACQFFPNLSSLQAKEYIKQLFAKSYGSWIWDRDIKKYVPDTETIVIGGSCSNAISTSSCNQEECGGADCISGGTSGLRCSGGSRVGQACYSDCGLDNCVATSTTINLYTCNGTASGKPCCSGSSALIAPNSCPVGDCRQYNDGYYRCVTGNGFCNPTRGQAMVCTDGPDKGMIVAVADYNCAGCTNASTQNTYSNYACSNAAPQTPVSSCCPGGATCATAPLYVCDNTASSTLPTYCTQCQGLGHCELNTISVGTNDWDPPVQPSQACPGNVRGLGDYCGNPPVINPNEIKVNSSTSTIELANNNFVNLTFTSQADVNQLPLVMYNIDWGDGTKTSVSGVEMRDRPNPANPHSLYHLYSYWELKSKRNNGVTSITCTDHCVQDIPTASDVACCYVTPSIKIKDNWGWCSGGECNPPGDVWQPFAGYIVIKEK